MDILSDSILQLFIKKNISDAITGTVCSIVFFGIVILAFYYNTESTSMFILNITVVLLIASYIFYAVIFKTIKKLNLIVKSVSIENVLILKTFDFRFFFFKCDSIQIEIEKEDFKIINGRLPINDTRLKNS